MSGLIGEIINQIVLLKSTIVITLISILCYLVVLIILTARFRWTGKNVKLIGFFYTISAKHSIMLGAVWVRFFLAISILIQGLNIYTAQIVLYLLTVVMYIAHRHKLQEGIVAALNSAVIVFAMYVASFLHSYLVQVSFSINIEIILILIQAFLVIYSIFDLVYSVIHITSDKEIKLEAYREIDKRTIERSKTSAERNLDLSKRKTELEQRKKTAEINRKKQMETAERAAGGK